jgi:hypothetical protein
LATAKLYSANFREVLLFQHITGKQDLIAAQITRLAPTK